MGKVQDQPASGYLVEIGKRQSHQGQRGEQAQPGRIEYAPIALRVRGVKRIVAVRRSNPGLIRCRPLFTIQPVLCRVVRCFLAVATGKQALRAMVDWLTNVSRLVTRRRPAIVCTAGPQSCMISSGNFSHFLSRLSTRPIRSPFLLVAFIRNRLPAFASLASVADHSPDIARTVQVGRAESCPMRSSPTACAD